MISCAKMPGGVERAVGSQLKSALAWLDLACSPKAHSNPRWDRYALNTTL
jgi:hypothetical protein